VQGEHSRPSIAGEALPFARDFRLSYWRAERHGQRGLEREIPDLPRRHEARARESAFGPRPASREKNSFAFYFPWKPVGSLSSSGSR
jgi:hypothetical protein